MESRDKNKGCDSGRRASAALTQLVAVDHGAHPQPREAALWASVLHGEASPNVRDVEMYPEAWSTMG